MSFPKYSAYNASGVEWLGEVPDSWLIKRFKGIFEERRERSLDGTEELLSVSAYFGVKPRAETRDDGNHLSRADSLVGYKVSRPSDLVMNIMLAWNRGLGFAWQDGIVSPAYSVFFVIDDSLPVFLDYLVRSDEYIRYFKAYSAGVIDSRLRLYPEVFGRLYVAVPSVFEQAQIARFLDHETAKIDALIAEQQRLIRLLKEKRQAVISQAVTKGLDPNVPLKDSGVQGLGEVPEHWAITKLGHYARVQTGFPFSSALFSLDDTDIRLLRGANVGVGSLKWEDTVYWSRSAVDQVSDYLMIEGQIVLGMDRPWISDGLRIARVLPADMPCLLLQRVAAITSREALSHDYLFQLLSSELFRAYVEPDLTGVSVPHISPEQILGFLISVPPVHEQNQIVEFLKDEFGAMEALLGQASLGVALLRERRAALISAAVTGKIDLRGWRPNKSSLYEQGQEDKSCLECA